MKIALVAPGFSRDADDWSIPALQTFACALEREAEVHVFSLRYPEAGLYRLGGVVHHASGGGTRFGPASVAIWLATLRAIVAEHRRAPFDVLHAFWVDEPGLTAVLAGLWLRRPVVTSAGGGELTWLPDIAYGTQGSRQRRAVVGLTLRLAGLVTAGSPYQLEHCRRHGVPDERLRLAPLGVECERFRPAAPPPWERPTLLQAGSMTPVKNQTLLLEVLWQARLVRPELRLILIGGGPLEKRLRKVASDLEVAENVSWQAAVAYPQMAGLYGQGHLYVQTSRHESQGMAVLEAMACGLPVVGTPTGVARELACRPAQGSAGALAAQVVELFSDREAFLAGRRLARQQVEERFCLATTVATFQSLYDRAGRGGRARTVV